jgi:tetratricopeptide (TPR) repeat protein
MNRVREGDTKARIGQGLLDLSDSPLLRCLARRDVQVGLLLALLTLIAYIPVFQCDLINFDDPIYVVQNMSVQGGLTLDTIGWAFTTCYASNWHPLTWLSLQLDVELFGGSARGFHTTNLILHILNVLLLYGLLTQLTGSWPAAALVAGLFGVHPLHVESVAWVTERKDVLSTFFGLLAIGAYLRYVSRPAVRRNILLLLAFAASLLAKPMLVTLPCLLLLLDWWPLRRLEAGQRAAGAEPAFTVPPASLRWLLAEKVPLLVLVLASSAATVYAQSQQGAVKSLDRFPLPLRLANAVDATAAYLAQTFGPVGLAAYYPYPRAGIPSSRVATEGLLLLAVTVLALCWVRSRPYLLVGWLWYLGTLVPVIGLVQVGSQGRADRYTYVPLIGIFLALVWGLRELLPARRRALGLGVAALFVLLPCSVLTWEQVRYWRNSLVLWEHALAVTSDNAVARTLYAEALLARSREPEAVEQLQEALRIYPEMDPALSMLGRIHEQHGRKEEALACYRAALAIRPDKLSYRAQVTRLEEIMAGEREK